jgi:hypothetical protein
MTEVEDKLVPFQRIISRSYTDVEINEQGINTDQFLEATDSLIKMFGINMIYISFY